MITSMLILCSTLMILWSATAFIWLASDKPLVQVTVQIVNTPQLRGSYGRMNYGTA